MQFTCGIRIDVADADNLGPFLDYPAALTAINALLGEAAANLEAAGSSFPFTLSSGFAGFNTPASFLTFNKAIAARVSLYSGNNAEALRFLDESFMDMTGDINEGPARFYSVAGGDLANNIFRVLDQADAIIAHPTFVDDLLDGDARASKIVERSGPLTLDELTGTHDVFVYKSLNDPVHYVRNEELILIAMEANIGVNNDMAVAALNAIRNANDLADYSGDVTDEALINELIFQRRYSLFGEGHRWVDMRRWNMLDQLPIDREGDDVWEKLPRPVSESG